MNNKSFYSLIVCCTLISLLFFLSSCVKNNLAEGIKTDNRIRFSASVKSGESVEGTKSADDAYVFELKSADGKIVLPVSVTVSDGSGIFTKATSENENKGLINNNVDGKYGNIPLPGDMISDFSVSAYHGAASFFSPENETASWNNSEWVLSHSYYWPQSTVLNFFAHANMPASKYASVTVSEDKTKHTLSYSVPREAKDQSDILMAVYDGTGNAMGQAELVFSHALTAVQFTRASCPDIENVKSITLSGVHYSGTAVQSLSNPELFEWTPGTEDATVTQDNGGLPLSVHGDIDGVPFFLVPQESTGSKIIELTIVLQYMGHDIPLNADLVGVDWRPGLTYTFSIKYQGTLKVGMEETVVSETERTDVVVKNTGYQKSYVRAMVLGYIIDIDGNIKSSWLDVSGHNKGTFEPSAFGSTDGWNDHWILGTDGFYYYTEPLAPGARTTNLFDRYTISGLYNDEHFKMDIATQSVEWDSNKSCVADAWGSEIAARLNK